MIPRRQIRQEKGITSTNVSLNYLATDTLTFNARYRTYSLDNQVPALVNSAGVVQNNTCLSQNVRSTQVDASYTGIRHMFWQFGFERRGQYLNENDSLAGLGQSITDLSPYVNADTETDYWRASFRYYPLAQLSLSASGEWASSNIATFAGTPDQSQNYSFNATYMLNDKVALYGDCNVQNGNNTEIRAHVPCLSALRRPQPLSWRPGCLRRDRVSRACCPPRPWARGIPSPLD